MGAKHLTNIDGRDIILYEKRRKRKQGGIRMEEILRFFVAKWLGNLLLCAVLFLVALILSRRDD